MRQVERQHQARRRVQPRPRNNILIASRLVSVLLEAKRTYPDRVFLLLGNRYMPRASHIDYV
jgi:hypothetical protein